MTVLSEVGCYGFLEPIAARSVDHALELCPKGAPLVGSGAREDLRNICLRRLGTIYERPLIQLAMTHVGFSESLRLNFGGEGRAEVMRSIADIVRDEVCADSGASLRASMPLGAGYEHVVAENFSKAIAEFLERLLLKRDEISSQLLGGRPIARITETSSSRADTHRHGRAVMCVGTDAGSFYYKPHGCELDALYLELTRSLFTDSIRAAQLVQGDGYAFVEQLVPEELSCEDELHAYWHNLGRLAALFHGLGSRDMTRDNIMCCGIKPAAVDLETLLTGQMHFDQSFLPRGFEADGIPGSVFANSIICTSVLPLPEDSDAFSPLMNDSESGTCLPRVGGEQRTVRGYERSFSDGFEQGYRHLMQHREEVLEALRRHADATCRQVLLNTWAYAKWRALLFSPNALSSPEHRDEVLAELNTRYAVFSPELQKAAFEPDALALTEGDIPYYCSRVGSRMLYAGDGQPVGDFLERSALEVATDPLELLSEEDLRFELGLISGCLATDASSGGAS